MVRTHRALAATTVAVLGALVAASCGAPPPPPPPDPPRTAPAPPAPVTSTVPACAPSSTSADPLPPDTSSAGTGGAVVVAEDDSGRPEIVTTRPDRLLETLGELHRARLEVVAVEADAPVTVADVAAAAEPLRASQWALTSLSAESAWAVSTGGDVDVAVVDTGVLATHPDLTGKLCSGVAYLGGTGSAQLGKGIADPNGHGTHVAGIAAAAVNGVGVAGVAPDADLIPVRVLDASGSGYNSDVAKGIIWAVDHGADVVNLSLGGTYASPAVSAAVDHAVANGAVVVAAAGNGGVGGAANYPAAFPATIAVGSHRQDGTVSSFSTRGDYVDLSAPGDSILSTLNNGTWGTLSGTSMATPHVAGAVAALLAAEPALDPGGVRSRLEGTAVDAGTPGHDPHYGNGRLDLVGALAG